MIVKVNKKQLFIRNGDDSFLMTTSGQTMEFPDGSEVVTLTDDAFGASSSWVSIGVEDNDEVV